MGERFPMACFSFSNTLSLEYKWCTMLYFLQKSCYLLLLISHREHACSALTRSEYCSRDDHLRRCSPLGDQTAPSYPSFHRRDNQMAWVDTVLYKSISRDAFLFSSRISPKQTSIMTTTQSTEEKPCVVLLNRLTSDGDQSKHPNGTSGSKPAQHSHIVSFHNSIAAELAISKSYPYLHHNQLALNAYILTQL